MSQNLLQHMATRARGFAKHVVLEDYRLAASRGHLLCQNDASKF